MLTRRLDDQCVSGSRTRSNLGVTDSPAQQAGVNERAGDKCSRKDCHMGRARGDWSGAPANERDQSQHAKDIAQVVCLVAHVLVRLYVVVTHSGHAAERMLC